MADRKALVDQNETPEDVATLYSWANLHGAKYLDFSASWAQMREKARLRVQEAIEQERRRTREEAEAQKMAEASRAMEAAHQAELIAQQEAQQAAQLAAQQKAQQRTWQHPRTDRFSALPAPPLVQPAAPYYPAQPQQPEYPAYLPPQAYRPAPAQPAYAPMREDSYSQPRNQWAPADAMPVDARESAGRPAWLETNRVDEPSQPAPHAPEDTLQGSRDRLASRWFALKGVFEGAGAPAESSPAPATARVPVLAVFSLAGGVGKTSLVATLGRALSARGERVLLVDTAAYGLLPFFFGARDQRPGLLRTFSPPESSADAPVQMVTIDPETMGPETAGQESLTQEITRYSHGASRVIVDLATASGATTRRVMRMSPMVLVPVIPDMNSVVSVSLIDAFFQRNGGGAGNRVALRRTPAVSEALAEGMTVMDYAPNSNVTEDFGSLAGWVKSVSAPASTGYRGVRWSER
jgi:cellulose biosynthesis protein BcsQ